MWLYNTFNEKILPVVSALVKMFVEKLGKAFSMIREKLDENRESLQGLRDFMDKVATFIQRYLGPALLNLGGKFLDAVIWGVGKAVDAFMKFVNIVKPIASVIFNAIKFVIEAIVKVINFGIKGINLFIKAYNMLPDWLKPFGDVKLIPEIVLPTFDLSDSMTGGSAIWGENRGDMPGQGAPGAGTVDVGGGTPGATGGSSGGTSRLRKAAEAIPFVPTGIDPFLDNPFVRRAGGIAEGGITVNVDGGLATSAEIGRAVVDAIKQYTNVSGPADIAVA
jgi:hypothetical protein